MSTDRYRMPMLQQRADNAGTHAVVAVPEHLQHLVAGPPGAYSVALTGRRGGKAHAQQAVTDWLAQAQHLADTYPGWRGDFAGPEAVVARIAAGRGADWRTEAAALLQQLAAQQLATILAAPRWPR